MTAQAKPKRTSRERTRAYRERLRAKGLKPVTLWLPDVNDPEFIAQMRRECRLISESPHEKEIMEWIDGVRYWPPDEPDMPDYSEDGPKEG
jgi:Protein  of unknown function (DUF3018)